MTKLNTIYNTNYIEKILHFILALCFIYLLDNLSIYLAFSPIPITFGTLAVFILALKGDLYIFPILLYVLKGAFSVYGAGYVFGYFISAIFIRVFLKKINLAFLLISANLIIYFFGVIYLAHASSLNILQSLNLGFYPFIIGDSLKIIIALFLYKKVNNKKI